MTICVLLITTTAFSQSIYTYSVPKIEGGTQPLNAYQNKRVLIITLPVQQNSSNDSLLHSLDSLRAANNGSLKIIAVPSFEDGYTPSIKSNLINWYRSILDNAIVITDGLYTRQTSGSQQHPLFQWLTDKDKNGHFDNDVTGPRIKFVVWTDGTLLGVLGVHSRLGGLAMKSLLEE